MILNVRQSPEDSLKKINPDDNRAKFEKISKTVKNSTVRPRNFSL